MYSEETVLGNAADSYTLGSLREPKISEIGSMVARDMELCFCAFGILAMGRIWEYEFIAGMTGTGKM
jgi:hypothetical protein